MKKVVLITLLACMSFLGFAQEKTEELSQSRAKEEYCMILATAKLLSTKVNIDVDYGQKMSFWKNTSAVKNEEGKRKDFNSVIDALNYMSSEGWEFVNAYSLTVGNSNVLHYVMKRDLKTEAAAQAE